MDPFFALLQSREENEAPFPQADHLKHTNPPPPTYYPCPTLSAVPTKTKCLALRARNQPLNSERPGNGLCSRLFSAFHDRQS